MRDPALDILLPDLQASGGTTLWLADENALDCAHSIPARENLTIMSNRFDVAQQAQRAGHHALFSDFDFSALPQESLARIVYRISKEKAVNHHVFNHASSLLENGGQLSIAGLKNEGSKTFIDKLASQYGNGHSRKHGVVYRGDFCKTSTTPQNGFDAQDYTALRLIQTPALDFFSKPGIFGWDKIDQGSAFLVEHLPEFLAQFSRSPQSMLDLGCGYGYLTVMTRHLPLSQRTATDNNAAALLAMQQNAAHFGMAVDVVADDAGASLLGAFDMILCNPPFHQGFSIESELTKKFLRHAAKLLSKNGRALFVVNSFIGIEKLARQHFHDVSLVANNGRFKLLACCH